MEDYVATDDTDGTHETANNNEPEEEEEEEEKHEEPDPQKSPIEQQRFD